MRTNTLLIIVILFIFNGIIVADENQHANNENRLPSPFSLEKAITYAEGHPRTRLSFTQQVTHNARQPLFLDCHKLTFNNTNSVDNKRNSIETNLVTPLENQKLLILQYYLDVLLADLNLSVMNENMAGTYIDYDRAKTRFELKQVSELVVAELNAEYQVVRQQFYASEATQRLTRSMLAQAVNHPEQLPSDLIPPQLIKIPEELPELDGIYSDAIKNNKQMSHLKTNVSKDQILLVEMDLRQQILELLLRLKVLKSAKQWADTENYRRELNLDLSRTLYEMEVKADLGNSMSLQTKAHLDDERYSYCQLLSWAQLNALQGLPLLNPPKDQDKPE